jgi:chemotaxis methyl-accepting protein methylase
MDDHQFRLILDYLGLSWAGYRKVKKGVMKRLARHMGELGCRNVGEYLYALDTQPQIKRACEELTAVSISRFFRDRALWQTLEEFVLPFLFQTEKAKIWSAGCGCGEEAYSFRMLWEKHQSERKSVPALEITGTDMNPGYLAKAVEGVYSRSSLKEVPDDLLSAFFLPQGAGLRFSVKPFLKGQIVWKQENLLVRMPETTFHLIFLRNNLLTYYKESIKNPAFRKIADYLIPGGFLVIGAHEKAPLANHGLVPCQGKPYLLQKGASLKAHKESENLEN